MCAARPKGDGATGILGKLFSVPRRDADVSANRNGAQEQVSPDVSIQGVQDFQRQFVSGSVRHVLEVTDFIRT